MLDSNEAVRSQHGQAALQKLLALSGIGFVERIFPETKARRSDVFKTIIGTSHDPDDLQTPLSKLVHPDDLIRVQNAFGRALGRSDEGFYNVMFRLLRADDGTQRLVYATGMVFFDARGMLNSTGFLQDLTELRRIGDVYNGLEPLSKSIRISCSSMRAARSLVKWSVQQLAKNANVSVSTIRRLEDNGTAPSVSEEMLVEVRRTLETAGVAFLPTFDGALAVCLS